jgi:hypothetical protein
MSESKCVLVEKSTIEHNRQFDGFEIWQDGKRIFSHYEKCIVWHMDCMMVAKLGENLPMWASNADEFDCHILSHNGLEYLTIGYK